MYSSVLQLFFCNGPEQKPPSPLAFLLSLVAADRKAQPRKDRYITSYRANPSYRSPNPCQISTNATPIRLPAPNSTKAWRRSRHSTRSQSIIHISITTLISQHASTSRKRVTAAVSTKSPGSDIIDINPVVSSRATLAAWRHREHPSRGNRPPKLVLHTRAPSHYLRVLETITPPHNQTALQKETADQLRKRSARPAGNERRGPARRRMPDVRGSRTGSTAIRGGRGRTAYVYVGQRPHDLCGRPARSTQVRRREGM